MNTRLLMTASSVFVGLIGVALSFMPNEIVERLGQAPRQIYALTVIYILFAIAFGYVTFTYPIKSG